MKAESATSLYQAQVSSGLSENSEFTPERYRQFLKFIPHRDQALQICDVGSGSGLGAAEIKRQYPHWEIIAVDCVQEHLNLLPKDIYAHAICGYSHDIPLDDGSVDVVIAGEFLEHVAPKYIFQTLCEFFRILKIDGMLLMTTPNPNYVRRKIQKSSIVAYPAHATQLYPDSLRRRLRDVGFSDVFARGSGRVSRYCGMYLPLCFYGSYLIGGRKW